MALIGAQVDFVPHAHVQLPLLQKLTAYFSLFFFLCFSSFFVFLLSILFLSDCSESLQIQAFINALPKYPLHSHGLIDAPKVLADIVESTIGAVFVDSNSSIDTTWKVCPVTCHLEHLFVA